MKNKVTTSIAIVLLLCIATAASASAVVPYGSAIIYKAFEQETGLELYEKEDISSNVLGVYHLGVEVLLLSDPAYDLTRVRIGETEGYMLSAYLVYDDTLISQLPAINLPVKTVSLNSTASKLNLRSTPSVKGKSLGQYKHGQQVIVLADADEWNHVKIGDKYGYMASAFLADAGTTAAIPSRATSQTAKPPVQGEARAYYATQYIGLRQYTVNASLTETAQNSFAVEISIQYPDQWTVNDDITSYGLYINGAKTANVPCVKWNDSSLPEHFSTTVEIMGTIQSIHIVPNWGKAPNHEQEAVVFEM